MNHLSIPEFYARFPNEDAARAYIAERRWGGEPVCPRCGSTKVWEIKGGMHYKCGDCPKSRCQFSVRTGTIMEMSRVSLQKWLLAMNLLLTARKGFSSIQFAKHLGVTQKTAWYMEHRIRKAFESETPVLHGEIEVDETYIGGKRANMSNAKRKALADTGRGAVGKAAVMGLQQRGGAVVAMHVASTDRATLEPIVEGTVAQGSSVYTDESRSYIHLKRAFDHQAVKHSASEYVRERASTNSIESFWALIKRGYYGTHHWWSFKHLHRYVAEYVYRQKTRHLKGLDAIGALIQASQGKTLSYETLTEPTP